MELAQAMHEGIDAGVGTGAALEGVAQSQNSALRGLEDPEWTRAALHIAGQHDVETARQIVGLRLEPEAVVALTAATTELPTPFKRDEQAWPTRALAAWRMPKDSTLAGAEALGPGGEVSLSHSSGEPALQPGSSTSEPRAALVTIGRHGGTRTLLNLLATRSTALDGPPVAVGATLSDIVVELALNRWAAIDDLVLVGFGRAIPGLEGARFVHDLLDARRLLTDRSTHRSPHRSQPRLASGDSGAIAASCFVVAPGLPGSGDRQMLRSFLASLDLYPNACVVCCDTSAPARSVWQLSAHRQPRVIELRRRNLVVATIPVAPELLAQPSCGEVHSEASGIGSAPGEPGTPALATVAPEPRLVAREPLDESRVRVNVLGPVDVRGTTTGLGRRKVALEALVYLVLHPQGVTGEALQAALWPDRRSSLQSLSNRLSEVRALLGTTSDGGRRLRRKGGRHVLADDVFCDWKDFQRLTGQGSTADSWRTALELVRGRPLQGLACGDWAVLEGVTATIEGAILETAINLAEASFEAGDPLATEWAVRRGLVVAPWDERLYRLLMRAADLGGNRKGIEAALKSLALALDLTGDPLNGIHPATAALYQRLMKQYEATSG